MSKLHRACEIVGVVATVNFLLFFVIALIIGGDALNGKEEAGHYYLANHGVLTEVSYFVFTYSKLHAISILITHPLAMIAGIVYGITGGWGRRPRTLTSLPKERPTNTLLFGLHSLEALYWKVSDFVEGIFWTLIDSWRKPDVEFFTKLSKRACIKELQTASNNDPLLYNVDKLIIGYFSGSHFYLRKWADNLFVRNVAYLVVAGKFSATPHGTYVRAWHRFATNGILFFTLWFGTVLGGLSWFLGVNWLRQVFPQITSDVAVTITFFAIVPALILIIFLISVWIGSRIGKVMNADLMEFMRIVLGEKGIGRQQFMLHPMLKARAG